MTIGEELRAYRQSQGLTLAQMARRLDVSIPFVSRVERGESPMPARMLRHLPVEFEQWWINDQQQRAWRAVRIAKSEQMADNK